MKISRFFSLLVLSGLSVFLLTRCGRESSPVEYKIMENGLTWVYDSQESPVSAAVICIRSPEFLSNPDLAWQTADLLLRGTEVRNQEQIFSQLESMGAKMMVDPVHEKIFFYLQAPEEHFSDCFGIFMECISRPTFDEEYIGKTSPKKWMLDYYHSGSMRKGTLKLMETMLEEMYTIPGRFDADSKHDISREDVIDFYNRWFRPEFAALTVTGPVDRSKIWNAASVSWKSSLIEVYERDNEVTEFRRIPPHSKEIIQENPEDRILLGYPAPAFDEQGSLPTWLLLDVLANGESSLIPNRLREQGLSGMKAESVYVTGQGFGFLMLMLSAPEGRGKMAKQHVLDILEDIKNNGVPEEALVIAKRKFISSNLIGFQYTLYYAAFLAARAILDHPVKDVESLNSEIQQITAEELSSRAQEILRDPTELYIHSSAVR